MSELNKIQAPILNDSYGENIEETFNKIDANFGILANKNLWKGDPGLSLVSLNIPWSVILSDPTAEFIEYPEGSGLKFKNYYNNIKSAFSVISSNEDDWDAVVNQLISIPPEESTPVIGLGTSIIASFLEPVEGDNSIIEFKTITPYVFMDERFRTLTTQEELNKLANCVDMSCVISMDCVDLDNSISQYKFICTQSFPTLYFNDSEESDGGLYWIINGSRTLIRAQGPAGVNGTTGNFYIGLADEGTINDEAWRNLDVNDSVSIYLSHLLVPGLTAEMIAELEDQTRIPFVNLTNGDYDNLIGEPYDTAPVIVLKQPAEVSEQLNPYYISALTRSMNGDEIKWYASVSPYNVCYAYLTDAIVKQAIMNNVWIIPESGSIPGPVNRIPSYPIRIGENDSSGYAMWAQNSSHPAQPSISGRPEFIFACVNDIKRPLKEGMSANFVFDGNLAEGYNTVTIGTASHAEGSGSIASGPYSHAEGQFTSASGICSHAEGYSSSASGSYSHAEGWRTTASGSSSHAEGYSSSASGSYSHAEGWRTTASGSSSHAEGYSSSATGTASHAEGYYTTASRSSSHAEGYSSSATGTASHAEGYSSSATGTASHAEGYSSSASGVYSHAEGMNTQTQGSASHAEGYANITGDYPGAIIAASEGSHAEGYAKQGYRTQGPMGTGATYYGGNIIASGTGSHAEGYATVSSAASGSGVIASGTGSHAEGMSTTASGDGSHAEGYYTTASGSSSHAEGYSSSATGTASHAEGYSSSATGTASHAEGYSSSAIGDYSHAEGSGSIASSSYSHAEGQFTTASGICSHTEGRQTKAIETGSHAEGGFTTASNEYSHAEGKSTEASGWGAHAEGQLTSASGNYSHAEGGRTIAEGNYSHAEGYGTNAMGIADHAGGYYNETGVRYGTENDPTGSFACGKYNAVGYAPFDVEVGQPITGIGICDADYIWSEGSKTTHWDDPIIFSIGNGAGTSITGSSHRCNQFFITRSGHGWIRISYSPTLTGSTYYFTFDDNTRHNSCDMYKRVF